MFLKLHLNVTFHHGRVALQQEVEAAAHTAPTPQRQRVVSACFDSLDSLYIPGSYPRAQWGVSMPQLTLTRLTGRSYRRAGMILDDSRSSQVGTEVNHHM